ncbi:MAG: hypothetical protein Kow0089_24140 [Desulfobulbaceae bacterium]
MKALLFLLICLIIPCGTAGYAQQNKVVVIPLNSSKAPTCTERRSTYTDFDSGSFLSLRQDCNSDEIAVSGGFGVHGWIATNVCYVFENRRDANGWYVRWASPTGNGCGGTYNTVYTSVVCCKW